MNKETLEEMRKNPDNWIWGVIYFNKKDPRVFLPKRIKGFGITINFAKPLSYVIVLLTIAFVVYWSFLR